MHGYIKAIRMKCHHFYARTVGKIGKWKINGVILRKCHQMKKIKENREPISEAVTF